MKIIIIGNGVAGTFAAQNIRNLDKEVEIEIYSQEKYPYYTRIKLPELISELVTIDDLIVFKEEWYEKNNIKTFLEKKIISIEAKEYHDTVLEKKLRQIEGVKTTQGDIEYLRLLDTKSVEFALKSSSTQADMPAGYPTTTDVNSEDYFNSDTEF